MFTSLNATLKLMGYRNVILCMYFATGPDCSIPRQIHDPEQDDTTQRSMEHAAQSVPLSVTDTETHLWFIQSIFCQHSGTVTGANFKVITNRMDCILLTVSSSILIKISITGTAFNLMNLVRND